MLFCSKRHRTIIRNKNPNMDNRNVTRILGELWAKLPPDEKKVYTDLAQQYKDAFMKANPEYKWYNPDKSSVPSKPTTRPSNAARHVNVMPRKYSRNSDSDDTIKPGKLADPNEMGGLNLLLMAGEEALQGPRTVIQRAQYMDTQNGNDQNVPDSFQKVEPASTEQMASIVTSQVAIEQLQRQKMAPNPSSGQEVVDHVIDQLYFSQRCRVNSGDTFNNNRVPTADIRPLNNPELSTVVSMAGTVGYSPKKEFQYRWRSMSASGQLESFKRFQASNMSRSHEVQNFNDIGMKAPPSVESSEKMEVEDDSSHDGEPTWKSPRANRGQRYKEMISEGLLQKHHKKNGSDSDDEAISHDGEFLPESKKAAARKRTVSESEAKAKNGTTDKRYKTGDFDLDAEIASLTPCSVESVCKKRSSRLHNSRMRHHSEGSKRQPNFTFDKVFTVGELHFDRLLCSPVPHENTANLVGSQRRKARKSSITHLIQVSSLEDISALPTTQEVTNTDGSSSGLVFNHQTPVEHSQAQESKGPCSLPSLSEITRTKLNDLGLQVQPSSQMCYV